MPTVILKFLPQGTGLGEKGGRFTRRQFEENMPRTLFVFNDSLSQNEEALKRLDKHE